MGFINCSACILRNERLVTPPTWFYQPGMGFSHTESYQVGASAALPLWKMMEWVSSSVGMIFHSQLYGKLCKVIHSQLYGKLCKVIQFMFQTLGSDMCPLGFSSYCLAWNVRNSLQQLNNSVEVCSSFMGVQSMDQKNPTSSQTNPWLISGPFCCWILLEYIYSIRSINEFHK